MITPVVKETILLPGAKVWQILGLEVFVVETDVCLFPTCLHNGLGFFFLLAFTKKLKFALPASNKLGSRRSGVVPEGVGRLEFWICRACCFVFCSHPETSSFSVLFAIPWESIMEVISISSCAALFLLLTEMLRSSFKLKYYFTRAAEVTWNHFPAAFWDPGNCVLIARNLEGWSVVCGRQMGRDELVGLCFKELLCSPAPFLGSWEHYKEKRGRNGL